MNDDIEEGSVEETARTPVRRRGRPPKNAGAAEDASSAERRPAARPRVKTTSVPRDVPTEWTPASGEHKVVEHEPADAERLAASNSVWTAPAAPAPAAPAPVQPQNDVVPEAPRPAAQQSAGQPSDGFVRRENQMNDQSAGQPASGMQQMPQGQADMTQPMMQQDGQQGYQQGQYRHDRFNRRDRFNRHRNRNQQNYQGQPGVPQQTQPGQPGMPQPQNMQQPMQNQGGMQQGMNGGRRLSRNEMRRMSRQERRMLRTQEDPYDPNLSIEQPEDAAPRPDAPPPVKMSDLQKLDVDVLLEQAEKFGLTDELTTLRKHEVVFELLKNHARRGGLVIGVGVLELDKDGTGYLRNEYNNYHTCPEDTYVLPAMVKRFGLRPGDTIVGPTRPPREPKDKHFVLVNVETVNGMTPAEARRIPSFENLTPLFPDRRINLETTADEFAMRIMNIVTPIGFGQRGLIVAPPRTGKTILMQKVANAISDNHPDVELIILLVDERPEEVTDMKRHTRAQVLSSTFDEPPERHVQVADIVIEKARRSVEMGKHVVILLDSITRLARAYNTLQPNSGKILSGGVDSNALQKPKRFFGAARNIEGGGSLTIIATALIDTGSRMDEVIFEEFKGTGNMELDLDRMLADKRIFPAINIEKSGTRKEDLLLHTEELSRTWLLRRGIAGNPPAEAMEALINRIKKTSTNAEFLMGLKSLG